MQWKERGHLRKKELGGVSEGHARWNRDALHSIMLMRRIIMSPPQAVEADRVGVGTSVFTFDDVICALGLLSVRVACA